MPLAETYLQRQMFCNGCVYLEDEACSLHKMKASSVKVCNGPYPAEDDYEKEYQAMVEDRKAWYKAVFTEEVNTKPEEERRDEENPYEKEYQAMVEDRKAWRKEVFTEEAGSN